MPSIKELRDRREAAYVRITDLAKKVEAEKRDFTADELANWNAANAEYDQLGQQIERAKRLEQIDRDRQRAINDDGAGRDDHDPRDRKRRRDNVQVTEEQRSLCFRAWARAQYGRPLTQEQRRACKSLRFDPRVSELRIDLWPDTHLAGVQQELRSAGTEHRSSLMRRESRANASAQFPTQGAYLTAPGTLAAAFELNLLAFGGALQVADIVTTQSGEPYLIPIVDDTANTGALLAENTQAMSSGVLPSFGRKVMNAYKFTSTPVLIPTELLEDDQYNLDADLGAMLGTRLARGQAPYLATGTGASQPEGIVTGATLGITTASATAITFDELVRLEHSIDPAYRSMPGVGWLMHDQVKSYIRRIKDGNGRPLWVQGEFYTATLDGSPERLLSYPINICQEMDSTVATTKKTVLFGLLSKFKVRRVRDVRLYRLVERFRDLDQDGFVAFQRIDSKVINAGTAPIKYLQQA